MPIDTYANALKIEGVSSGKSMGSSSHLFLTVEKNLGYGRGLIPVRRYKTERVVFVKLNLVIKRQSPSIFALLLCYVQKTKYEGN